MTLTDIVSGTWGLLDMALGITYENPKEVKRRALHKNKRSPPGWLYVKKARGKSIYKFQTQHNNADQAYNQLVHSESDLDEMGKIRNDPRVIPSRRIHRKLKIDEIPQVVNWLRGDIRFIGYRPRSDDEEAKLDSEHVEVLHSERPAWLGIHYWPKNGRKTMKEKEVGFYNDIQNSKYPSLVRLEYGFMSLMCGLFGKHENS